MTAIAARAASALISADEFPSQERRRAQSAEGYRDAGPRELWLVDTPASSVLIYRAGSFGEPTEVGPGEQLTSRPLPGFALPIDELLAG